MAAPSRGHAQDTPATPIAVTPPASRTSTSAPTVRATRLDTPLHLDGRLDEAVYEREPQIGEFIQAEPEAGEPISERTDVWILFDDENVYVAFRCWDSHPERMVVNELRRDHINISQNEHVGFGFDTFLDRRNGLIFNVTPAGARLDGEVADERQFNLDWNPVWSVATGRFEQGWTAEVAVPFKSLRYRPGRDQVWGLQIFRQIRWKNEIAYMAPLPPDMARRGPFMWSLAGTLEGLKVPVGARRLEFRPYARTSLITDAAAQPPVSNEPDAKLGLDVKIGLTQSLTADVTVNTDFGQVEADEEQVNLTRFSLFFPEKREFFLENQGAFLFAGGTLHGASDIPTLFYSRRIGLHQGRAVPIRAGGRLTGRVGRVTVGALNIQTGDDPVSLAAATNFSVVRVKSDLLRRSNVGMLFGHRSVSERGAGANDTMGVDATFAFYDNLTLTGYWARASSEGTTSDDTSYFADVNYAGDRYGVRASHLAVGAQFNPEIGFVRRQDIRKSFAQFRFSPRPKRARVVRKYSFDVWGSYIEDGAGRPDAREADGSFGIEFQNSDSVRVAYHTTYEFLPRPFTIADDVTLPGGGYRYDHANLSMTFGQHRRLSGTVSAQTGTFYDGHRTTVGVRGGRVEVAPRLSLQPTHSMSWIDLPAGAFRTTLTGSRVTFTVTPLMFTSALIQYNSSNHTVAANVRLRWEYQPGSELFVVYSDQRDVGSARLPEVANRTFIVKINRLFRF